MIATACVSVVVVWSVVAFFSERKRERNALEHEHEREYGKYDATISIQAFYDFLASQDERTGAQNRVVWVSQFGDRRVRWSGVVRDVDSTFTVKATVKAEQKTFEVHLHCQDSFLKEHLIMISALTKGAPITFEGKLPGDCIGSLPRNVHLSSATIV